MTSKKVNLAETHVFTSRAINPDLSTYPTLSPINLVPGANEILNIDEFSTNQISTYTSTAQIYGTINATSHALYSSPDANQNELGISVSISKIVDFQYILGGAPKSTVVPNTGGCVSFQGVDNSTPFGSVFKLRPTTGDINVSAGTYSQISEDGNLAVFGFESNSKMEVFRRAGTTWTSIQIINPIGRYMSLSTNLMVISDNLKKVEVWGFNGGQFNFQQTLQFSDPGAQITTRSMRISDDNTIAYISNEILKIWTISAGVWTQIQSIPVPNKYMVYLYGNMLVVGQYDEIFVFERGSNTQPFGKTQTIIPSFLVDNIACNDYSVYLSALSGFQQYVRSGTIWVPRNPFYTLTGYSIACNNQWIVRGYTLGGAGSGEIAMIRSNYYVNENIVQSSIVLHPDESLITLNADNINVAGNLTVNGDFSTKLFFIVRVAGTQVIPTGVATLLDVIFTAPTITNTGNYSYRFNALGDLEIIVGDTGFYDIQAFLNYALIAPQTNLNMQILVNAVAAATVNAQSVLVTGSSLYLNNIIEITAAGAIITVSTTQSSGANQTINVGYIKLVKLS